jgi:hypothetical protein
MIKLLVNDHFLDPQLQAWTVQLLKQILTDHRIVTQLNALLMCYATALEDKQAIHQKQWHFQQLTPAIQAQIDRFCQEQAQVHSKKLSRAVYLTLKRLCAVILFLKKQQKLSVSLYFEGFTDPIIHSYIQIDRKHGKSLVLDYHALFCLGKIDPVLSRQISDELDGPKPESVY